MVHADEDSVGVKDDESAEEAVLAMLLPAMIATRCLTCKVCSKIDLVLVSKAAEIPEKEVVLVSVIKARLASIGRDELKEREKCFPRVVCAVDCVLGKKKDVDALLLACVYSLYYFLANLKGVEV